MGHKQSQLRPEQLSDLVNRTEFTEQEIIEWYKDFKRDCPSGFLGLKDFQRIYSFIFPRGDPSLFAEQVFRVFDMDNNGVIDFREFLCALSITSRGTVQDKLAWSFRMYDVDDDNYITKQELLSTINALYKMVGPLYGDDVLNIARTTDQTQLADRIFKQLDKNEDGKLSKEEFIVGAKDDPVMTRILTCDMSRYTRVKDDSR